jgi:glycosyltransferase involved in cell wall biosynthesis
MRIAFFSPMPPAKTGIADYSAALIEPLALRAKIDVFDHEPSSFDPGRYDIALYQIGNNPHHAFVYRAAVRHPGVVVLHEATLHHLIDHMFIGGGDWDGYLREAEYDGGPAALARARRVRALEVGPDYAGVPMTRRLLENARGAIVHSQGMVAAVRKAGFRGPVERIPHGAWINGADGLAYRERLGVERGAPLIGTFGFLKPYKRIAESLRAFRRLVRVEPRAKMILAGEAHPDFPIASLVESLGLSASVRVLGFASSEDFTGYMAACDAILNLRYPTAGETSGTLLRALGLGKPVLVSDVGSFRELPDDICLKVAVDGREEDELFEFLSLLVSRPNLACALGARALRWVEQECGWTAAAGKYAAFLESVARPAACEMGREAFA